MKLNSTYLGSVQDVEGSSIGIVLDKDTISGLAFIDGHGYRIGQIGSFVRIPIGFVDLFGIVSQVGAGAVPSSLVEQEPFGHRWLRVQLIGESQGNGQFQRGVSSYPTISDEVHLVTETDLIKIYGRPESNDYVRIGTLASAESIASLVDVNRLISRHSAVLGSTGCGKSTTVANLVNALSDPNTYPASRIIIIDIHGEYADALKDRANTFRVNPAPDSDEKPLNMPYWALTFDEMIGLTSFSSIGETDRASIMEKVVELKKSALNAKSRDGVSEDSLTVDTPIPFSIHKLWYDLHRMVLGTHTAAGIAQNDDTEAIELDDQNEKIMGDIMNVIPPRYRPHTARGGADRVYLSSSTLNIRRQVVGLGSQLRDIRYDFIFRPGKYCPDKEGVPEADLDDLLESWIGGDKPVTILDLSGVPVAILMDLIGILLRVLYEALFWGRFTTEGGRDRPLLLILEEAHTYLSSQSKSLATKAAGRLVKEGRKYGLSAMIVSQRPSEIDSTILSQCGTLFAMRLSNSTDKAHVTSAASENLSGLFNMLPSLRTGEAIIVGEAVQLPQRTLIDSPKAGRWPDSRDPLIATETVGKGWNSPKVDEDYKRLLKIWREQNPRDM